MNSPQPSPDSVAALMRARLRAISETWIDDDGETDMIRLDEAIVIVDDILSKQPTVTYQQRMETR